jgi:hypothetical protein
LDFRLATVFYWQETISMSGTTKRFWQCDGWGRYRDGEPQ